MQTAITSIILALRGEAKKYAAGALKGVPSLQI
jgi:hypothetical protein